MSAVSLEPRKLNVKSKIWIEDERGDVVLGAGRLRILSLVEEQGSLLAASKVLKMSYRAVWGKIKASEERLGQALLAKRGEGGHSAGSELTPFARMLVERFRELENLSRTSADDLFQDVFQDLVEDKRSRSKVGGSRLSKYTPNG